MWRTHFVGKKAELFHCEYAVPDKFVDGSKIPTEALNGLEGPP